MTCWPFYCLHNPSPAARCGVCPVQPGPELSIPCQKQFPTTYQVPPHYRVRYSPSPYGSLLRLLKLFCMKIKAPGEGLDFRFGIPEFILARISLFHCVLCIVSGLYLALLCQMLNAASGFRADSTSRNGPIQ